MLQFRRKISLSLISVFALVSVVALVVGIRASAEEFPFQRLSDDDATALFHVVVIGNPENEHIAFLFGRDDECVLEVRNRDNQPVLRFAEFKVCELSDEEDGYSYVNAGIFDTFVSTNGDIFRPILDRYDIGFSRPKFYILSGKELQQDCAIVAEFRVCAAADIEVEFFHQ